MTFGKRCAAELLGTFWLVFMGCGSAVIAAKFPEVGIGLLGVSLAFGLSLLTMAYAIGTVSGAHLNPAVSLGLTVAGRFPGRELPGYVISQIVGAILASIVLFWIASGSTEFDLANGFAANGYGLHSPGGYNMLSSFLAEGLFTFMFLMIILGVTDERAPKGMAPLAIGLALTLIHLVGIPITNTSVNPARSTGPALVVGGWALSQLWLFWLAPAVGAAVAGWAYPKLFAAARVPEKEQEEILRKDLAA
ncbi:MAG: aquaporin Z [Oligoflexia bacterium]|nr:aquaporin Z [Oligoflexia bacterium]